MGDINLLGKDFGQCRLQERQTTFKVFSATGAGSSQAINDFSDPLGLILNQRAFNTLRAEPGTGSAHPMSMGKDPG